MKLNLVLILFGLICSSKIGGQEKIITIKNDKALYENKFDSCSHRDKDVEIIRAKIDSKDVYIVILYRVEDGKLNDFKDFMIDSKNEYDKATYEWIDDSTLKLKVFNSTSGLSESFIQTGYGKKGTQLKRLEIK